MSDLEKMRELADATPDHAVVQMTPAKYRALIACAEALELFKNTDFDRDLGYPARAALAQLEAAP